MSRPPITDPQAAAALRAAHQALARGDKEEARRQARLAAKLAPDAEEPWLYLAAASEAKAGLAYLARALEINPRSKQARKAIRWMVRRLPPRTRKTALQEFEGLAIQPLPLEAFSPRRILSWRITVPALALAAGVGLWMGQSPADARESHSASAPVEKATLTPTPTNTPTATPTPPPTR